MDKIASDNHAITKIIKMKAALIAAYNLCETLILYCN